MEDKRQSGYPIYTEDELGMIQQVVSASDCTGLQPPPPFSQTRLNHIPSFIISRSSGKRQ
jgi:hypothetical protein